MIRHIVLVNFRPDTQQREIEHIFASLRALQDSVPGIVAVNTGADNSPEGLARGFTHGFTVDFVDQAARDAYLPHPEHAKVGGMIVEAAEGGIDGLVVLDFTLTSDDASRHNL